MNYKEKYQELVELFYSENLEIKRLADNWLIGIGLQETNGVKVSPFLLDLAIRNVKGELTHNDVSRLIEERYADSKEQNFGLGGDYEIIPADSPKIKEIEELDRKLRLELCAQLDKK